MNEYEVKSSCTYYLLEGYSVLRYRSMSDSWIWFSFPLTLNVLSEIDLSQLFCWPMFGRNMLAICYPFQFKKNTIWRWGKKWNEMIEKRKNRIKFVFFSFMFPWFPLAHPVSSTTSAIHIFPFLFHALSHPYSVNRILNYTIVIITTLI